MKSILVSGVHASGKSTIGNRLSQVAGIPFLEYSDFMLSAMGETNRDEILKIPFVKRKPIYEAANRELIDWVDTKISGKLVLLTTHLTLRLNGVIEVFEHSHYNMLGVSGILLVEATAERIIERRSFDIKQRLRPTETVEQIIAQQSANEVTAFELARALSISCTRFHNEQILGDFSRITEWAVEIAANS